MSIDTLTSESRELPSLVERPNGFVVIFDGHCRFCLANMRVLRSIDGDRLAYVSLHEPMVREKWPDLTHEMLMKQIYVIDGDGHRHGGAAAFRFLSRHLPWLWILAPLLHIPGSLPVWQLLYKQIARIRYRFGRIQPCDGDACAIHFSEKP